MMATIRMHLAFAMNATKDAASTYVIYFKEIEFYYHFMQRITILNKPSSMFIEVDMINDSRKLLSVRKGSEF